VLVIPPGQTFRWGSRGQVCAVRQAQFKGTLLNCVDLADLYMLPLVLKGQAGHDAGEAIDQLKRSYCCKDKHDLYEMIQRRQLCFSLMALLTKDAVFKGDPKQIFAQTHRLLPVFRMIHEHLQEEISRETLAAQVNLSPSRFSALFSSCTGQSPMQYVRQARLRQVQHLLWTTNLSIGEIAEKLRFYDAFHLSKQFSKAFDISPTEFRRTAGQMSLFHAAS
jgi:AraC-like DNA-binding protein